MFTEQISVQLIIECCISWLFLSPRNIINSRSHLKTLWMSPPGVLVLISLYTRYP